MLDRQIENAQLLFDTAVEFAVILMAAACSENCAVRISMKKLRDGPRSEGRVAKVIETEFEKVLAGLGFPAGLFEQSGNVRQTERNADLRKRAPLGHIWFIRISEGNARPTEAYQAGISGAQNGMMSSVARMSNRSRECAVRSEFSTAPASSPLAKMNP